MNALDDSNYKMEDLVTFVRYLNKKIENLRTKEVKKSRINVVQHKEVLSYNGNPSLAPDKRTLDCYANEGH